MAQFSFDIVSEIDLQEVDNAVNQASKEVKTRFDFRGSKSCLEFVREEKKIKLLADDDLKLRNLIDILRGRIAARKISAKALKFEEAEKAFEGTLRQEVGLVQGLDREQAKKIVQIIKASRLKVQASIQEDQVRVTSRSKDDLQGVMSLLQKEDLSVPLQFVNFR